MVSRPRFVDRRGGRKLLYLLASVCAISLAAGCDKVPLTAPTGSVITLFPSATFIPSNGQMEIIATVIEQGVASAPPTTTPPATGGTTTTPTATSTAGAGTPVQNGTLVTFTTTLGRIEPREARTRNGEVRVNFFADGQSGTATITAFSGGASGRLENFRVGSAAVARITTTASPQALSCTGGTSEVVARVEDASGVAVPGVPVTFSTTRGQLSPATSNTDASGVARTQLTTTQEATVTASAAGQTAPVTVTISPRTGINITPPSGQVSAGVATTFTVNVAGTANINNVAISFGDGTVRNLGPISGSQTVPHTFQEPGTYTISATASDAAGCSERVSTAVNILPAQPPTVTINVPQTARVNQNVVVTANVSGNTSAIVRYIWDFGPGAIPETIETSSRQVSVRWTTEGTKTIRVRVIQASGPEGDAVQAIEVVRQ